MRIVFGILLFLLTATGFAQNGTISGEIRDNATDTTLYRAKIFIKGTALGAYSGMRGKYTIKNVPPGTYNLTVLYLAKGYNKTIPNIIVKAGEAVLQDVELGASAVTVKVKTLDLSDFVDKASEEAAINDTKNSTKTVSIVTTEETSKQGISNVGGAVKRVSGVSLEGGKYANIRGLNGRYNKTLLNGSEIPGLDPNRNAVQLDLFPTAFLSSIKVVKTFSPDLPGDFTGGLINITLKEAPDSFQVKVGLGTSYNTQVNFQDNFLTYQGSSTDALGFDNGDRAIPDPVLKAINGGGLPSETDVLISDDKLQESSALSKSFNPIMAPDRLGAGKGGLNSSLYFTIGNTIKRDSTSTGKFGYFVGFNYRRGFSHYENGEASRYILPGSIDDVAELLAQRSFRKTESKESVLMGGIASLSYKSNSNNSIHLNYIHNHSGEQRASNSIGTDLDQPDSEFRVSEVDYLQRAINSVQLIGKHKRDKLFDKILPTEFNWLASGTHSSQDQPDYRIFSDHVATLSDGSKQSLIAPAIYNLPTRFYRNMSEINSDVKLDYTITIKDTDTSHFNIKIGASNTYKSRVFEEKRFEYDLGSVTYNGTPNDITKTKNVGVLPDASTGLLLFDVSELQNNYSGIRMITGAFGMADFSVGKVLDVVAGARYENTIINVKSDKESLPEGNITVNDILPSVGLIFNVFKDKKVNSKRDTTLINSASMKVRVSYNRTVARPNFREIAPYASEDFVRKTVLLGNLDLMPSDINNFDLRWEYYPRTNEIISVSGFYKEFINPIGLFSNPAAGNAEFQWKNLEYSTVYGGEVEFKKRLDFIWSKLDNFSFGFNFTLVKSITPIPEDELERIRATDSYREDTRPLTGQSPYLVNSTFEYNNDSLGLNINLTFNMFGDRLTIYSSDGRPDVYEQSRPMINFNFSKEITPRFKVKFRINNLLDPTFAQRYEYKNSSNAVYEKFSKQEANFSSYKKGRSIGLGVSYLF